MKAGERIRQKLTGRGSSIVDKLDADSRRKGSHDSESDFKGWVPDGESRSCMICDSEFGIFNRRHHCRKCGLLVCNSCSLRKIHFKDVPDPGRICDKCFETLQHESSSDKPLKRAPSATALVAYQQTHLSLAPWMYVFKPFGEFGKNMPIGRIQVEVLEARRLPRMDLIGSCDPFVVLELGNQSAKTKTLSKTMDPVWRSAEFIFNVYSSFDVIKFSVFDYDFDSAPDLIGIVEIPVAELSHELEFSQWYMLKLDPAVVKAARDRKEVPPMSELFLKLHYTYSKAGDFFSHFNPPVVEKPPAPDFELMRTVSEAFRLLGLLQPVFWVLGQVSSVIFWTDTFTSMAVFAVLSILVLLPWTFWPFLQILLLVHMTKNWVSIHVKKSTISAVEVRELRKSLEEAATTAEDQQRMIMDGLKDKSFDSFFTSLASKSINAAGMNALMKWLQNLIAMINNSLELIYNLFNWSSPPTTWALFIILSCTTLYSFFFDFRWIILIVVVYVMTMFTVPGITFMWALMGVVRYLTRSRPQALQDVSPSRRTPSKSDLSRSSRRHSISRSEMVPVASISSKLVEGDEKRD